MAVIPSWFTHLERNWCRSVEVHIAQVEKESVTVDASLTAGGTKLPPFFTAQSKTCFVHETQIGNADEH
jgi:hypothetical protein